MRAIKTTASTKSRLFAPVRPGSTPYQALPTGSWTKFHRKCGSVRYSCPCLYDVERPVPVWSRTNVNRPSSLLRLSRFPQAGLPQRPQNPVVERVFNSCPVFGASDRSGHLQREAGPRLVARSGLSRSPGSALNWATKSLPQWYGDLRLRLKVSAGSAATGGLRLAQFRASRGRSVNSARICLRMAKPCVTTAG